MVASQNTEAASSKALAFPKFELTWFLATFEGLVMACAFVFVLGDEDSTLHQVLKVLAILSLAAIAGFIFMLAFKVHRQISKLKTKGALTFHKHKLVPMMKELYKEFNQRGVTQTLSNFGGSMKDLALALPSFMSHEPDEGDATVDALEFATGSVLVEPPPDIPSDSNERNRKVPSSRWKKGSKAALMTTSLKISSEARNSEVITFETLVGQLAKAHKPQAQDYDLQDKLDYFATMRVQAAFRRLLARRRARQALERQQSELGVPTASGRSIIATEGFPLSPPASPPASGGRASLTSSTHISVTIENEKSFPQGSRRSSRMSIRQRASSIPSPRKVRRTLSEVWTPFEHPHPQIDDYPVHSSAGLAARISCKSGKLWGVRHTAQALAWFESIDNDQRSKVMKALGTAELAAKRNGHWKVETRSIPKEERAKVTKFMGGYGELFEMHHEGHHYRLFPNHVFFAFDISIVFLKVVGLVLVTNVNLQMPLLILLDAIGLVTFLIQRPFADHWLNLDVAFGKATSLVSFLALAMMDAVEEPVGGGRLVDIGSGELGSGELLAPDYEHDAAIIQAREVVAMVMTLNLVALYWMIAMQLLRQIKLAFTASIAGCALLSCCAAVCGLAAKGKITPKKLYKSESRGEVIAALKSPSMKLMKAAGRLKKAASTGGGDDDDSGASNPMGMLSEMSKRASSEFLKPKLKHRLKPMVEERGMPWAAVETMIDELDTQKEVEDALSDPEGFLKRVALGFALDVLVHKLKVKLKPIAPLKGIPWPVAEAQIDALGTVEELEEALSNIEPFMLKLADAAVATMVVLLKQNLKPIVEAKGLPWEIIEPPIDELDTMQELQAALADVEAFLMNILEASVSALIILLKDRLRDYCKQKELPWDAIEPAVEELDTAAEIQAAIADIESFLMRALAASISSLIILLKSKLRPYCEANRLPWVMIEPVIDELDTAAEIQSAIADVDTFLMKILATSAEALVLLLKGKLRPICEARGLPWYLVEPAIDELDTAEEIQAAIADIDGFLTRAFAASVSVLIILLKGKLRPICESRGWPWAVIEPQIDALDTPNEVQSALADLEGWLKETLEASFISLVELFKDKLKPICEVRGLPWPAVEPQIDLLDTPEEVLAAIKDLDSFLMKALESSVDALMVLLKEKMRPICTAKKLPWPLVEPVIDALDSAKEIQEAVVDIEGFLMKALASSFEALVTLLKETMKPICQKKGLPWSVVEPVIDALDTAREVQEAISDINAFLSNALASSGKALMVLLKDKLKEICERRLIPWSVVGPALDALDTAKKIQAAMADAEGYLADVLTNAVPELIVVLKDKLKPIIVKRGLPWNVIEPQIDALNTAKKIQAALSDTEGFMLNAFEDSIPALHAILKDKLKPICEVKGLRWGPVEAQIDALDSVVELTDAITDPAAFFAPRKRQIEWLQQAEHHETNTGSSAPPPTQAFDH